MQKPHILVAEDDWSSRDLVSILIQQLGENRTTGVATGSELFKALHRDPADLIVLDLDLPDENGLALARQIRATSNVPIIVVTADETEDARISALDIGVDDYLTKPFNLKELQLRIRNMLRRTRRAGGLLVSQGKTATIGKYRLDETIRALVASDGDVLQLTKNEFLILQALSRHPGTTLSRGSLVDAIANGPDAPNQRAIDIYIKKLREKLGDDARSPAIILSVRGIGYRLSGE